MATKKDYLIVSVIGIVFGLFLIPILQNIRPAFWQLSFINVALLIGGFWIFADLALYIGSVIGKRIFSMWQFVKFAAVGSLNAVLDIGTINLLSLIFKIYSGIGIAIFNFISVSIAIVNSYLLNKFWSFSSAKPIRLTEFVKFVAVSFVTTLINTAIVYLLTTVVGPPVSITPQIWENISKLVAIPVILIVNFFGYKFIVFK